MRILALDLLTDHLDETKQFYNEILGLKIDSVNEGLVSFSLGHSTLTFHRSAGEKPVYHFAFNIPHNQFEAALDWAGKRLKLITVESLGYVADFKSWNARAFYFYDNNQNIVEMIARYDLPNESDKPFDGSSIYSISEIGAVVDDPLAFAETLQHKYNLSYFSKQQPMKDFMAVGDDEGLFIIVPPKRTWYPTSTPSSKHWTRVSIEVNQEQQEIVSNE